MNPRKSLLALCLSVFAMAVPSLAQDNPTIPVEAIKFIGTNTIGKLTEMGYNTNCKAKDLDYKSDDSWYCGLFATLSGAKEGEWKERVDHQLAVIRSQVEAINATLREIQSRQDQIYRQNEQILNRIDEIGPKTIVGGAISSIRTDWNDQYIPLFTGQRQLSKERALSFARQIIFVDRLHQSMGNINDQLTHGAMGNETLLRSYARGLHRKMQDAKQSRPEAEYEYMEWIVQGLLAEERKGYAMYVWAAETLESNCEVTGDCKDASALPPTATEYRSVFARYMEEQLAEFNASTEWMLLAASDPHSRNPNFLHPDAERIFARADLFTSANLGKYGIRGRILSMGDTFDGKLPVGDSTLAPTGLTGLVATDPGRLDWWKAAGAPNVYDEVHFSDRWKVYHYESTAAKQGTYALSKSFPYKPGSVEVKNVPADGTTTVPFGSFTIIERAGGGYALLSGGWSRFHEEKVENATAKFIPGFDNTFYDAGQLLAGMRFGATLEWKLVNAGKDQYLEAWRKDYAVSNKKVRYPDGGDLAVHLAVGDTYPTLCKADCSDFSHNQVVGRLFVFKKAGINSRSGKANTRAFFLLGDAAGSNGVVYEKSNGFDDFIDERPEGGKNDSARVTLAANAPYPIVFGGDTTINVQTSGLNETRFVVTAIIKVENAYLTTP
jgi:hypothetical protein